MRSPICFCAVVALGAGAAGAPPPDVFTNRTYDQARELSEASDKLFLVDATAVWCAPCKMMDKSTWIDERVVEWLSEHAVAVQLDVDKDPRRAGTLDIAAMPTLIVFKEGHEFDRVVGYKSADELLEWLNGVRKGRRAIDALRDDAAAGPNGKVNVESRLRLARQMAQSGRLDDATVEYIWLWDNMLEHLPAMYGVRLSFMVSDMSRLAYRHEPAKEAFRKLRDRYAEAVAAGTTDRDELVDWLHLNQVIFDQAATLVWYDEVKNTPKGAAQIAQIEHDVYELLVSRKRWADAGRVLRDPVSAAEQAVAFSREISQSDDLMGQPDAKREMINRFQNTRAQRDLLDLYASCLAADRRRESYAVADILLREHDDGLVRLELVQIALTAGKVTQRHVQLLDEADAKGAPPDPTLRADVEQLLAPQ